MNFIQFHSAIVNLDRVEVIYPMKGRTETDCTALLSSKEEVIINEPFNDVWKSLISAEKERMINEAMINGVALQKDKE